MRWLNMYISDYALIIILITVVLRLVLSPVDITQRVNSAKMQLINPEIQRVVTRKDNVPNVIIIAKPAPIKPIFGEKIPKKVRMPMVIIKMPNP